MSYKMPIVCKEVYIPIDITVLGNDGITLDEYKKIYGVDLRDHFQFENDNTIAVKDKSLNKYYVVTMYGVNQATIIHDVDNNRDILGYYQYAFKESESKLILSVTFYSGIRWDHSQGKIYYVEF